MSKVILFLSLLVFLLIIVQNVHGQNDGRIKGKVFVLKSKEPVPYANVQLLHAGRMMDGVSADLDGNFVFHNVAPGKYDVLISSIGFSLFKHKGLSVNAGSISFVTAGLSRSLVITDTAFVEGDPIIRKDPGPSGSLQDKEVLESLPASSLTEALGNVKGAFESPSGGFSLSGARLSSTKYALDNIPSSESLSIPLLALEQVEVIHFGLSARYGDVSGGLINLSTKSYTPINKIGLEAVSSHGMDPFGYSKINLFISGPFRKPPHSIENKKWLRGGYFLIGEYTKSNTNNPSAVGEWKMKEDVLNEIQNNPLQVSHVIDDNIELVPSSHYVTNRDFYRIPNAQNDASSRVNALGKLTFHLGDFNNLTLGAYYNSAERTNYIRSYSLFNSANMPSVESKTFRMYAKHVSRFGNWSAGNDSVRKKGVKNSYLTMQVAYTNRRTVRLDPNLGMNPFNYGYVGRFQEHFALRNENFESLGDLTNADTLRTSSGDYVLDQFGNLIIGDPSNGILIPVQNSFSSPNGISFLSGSLDHVLTSYQSDWFSHLSHTVTQLSDILGSRGIVNGSGLPSVQNIWSSPGSQVNGFGYSNRDYLRLNTQVSGELNGHFITVGLEFDQRIERSYGIAPFNQSGLWLHARGLVNGHIAQRDLDNPILSYDAFGTVDSVLYNRLYQANDQSTFDRNLRKSLGMAQNGFDVVQLMNLSPDQIKLKYFAPDELLQDGRAFVEYYGYSFSGEKLKRQPAFDNFFSDTAMRSIAAFQPNYTAFFIEDKFDFDDVIFRIGMRVDRFDANQPVLKDPYLFVPAYTAAETSDEFDHPSSIGGNYVVYVDDAENPSMVLGYRNKHAWYGPDGKQIRNASNIASQSKGGEVQPYLREGALKEVSRGTDINLDALEDYRPQINVMPRISFSFPISDEALFFAHYDVLTERPSTGFRFNPVQYAFVQRSFTGSLINNPNLKPQRTVDYEMGFKQRLGKRSALTVSAFYREFKDMIQRIRISHSFPVPEYSTYGNIDFATVKGLSISYDLRRTGNVRLSTSYTLQYADGTGSNENSAANLIAQPGSDNLRTIRPLDYDTRHRLVANLDIRYGKGKKYSGPRIGSFEIFRNMGSNITMSANSGTPYSKNRIVSPDGDVVGGIAGISRLDGEVNGANLPWNLRANLRVDKDFYFKMGKEDERAKRTNLKVYLQINNLFNTLNVVGAYRFTGSPSDDGFLNSGQGQQVINNAAALGSAQSFIDLYEASMENPNFYGRPRTVRLGLRFGL